MVEQQHLPSSINSPSLAQEKAGVVESMDRRSLTQRGFVNFPVQSLRYKNTMEGGMSVYLVALEEGWEDRWPVCCVNYANVPLSEIMVGDDQIPTPPPADLENLSDVEFREALDAEQAAGPENFHYPNLRGEDKEDSGRRYDSVPYLAAILLGSTGWSGWDEKKACYWKCEPMHLTQAGFRLYTLLKQLYGGQVKLHLVTFLDT